MIVPHIDAPRFLPRFTAPQLPPVIGHRGAAARAPENTLAGLHRAKELGCTWVEFDVRLTADGIPVLCHDPRLDRTTDGTGRIARLTFAAVRQCDAGARFDPAFAGELIPTLEEALLLCAELGLGANIELKADYSRDRDTAAAVAAILVRLNNWRPAVLVSSFRPWAFFRSPEVPRGMLFRMVPRNWSAFAERFKCSVIGADHRRLKRRRVAEMRDAGYQVAAFTVNDPARARLLFEWGVTSVFSDAPDILLGINLGQSPVLMRQGAMR